MRIVVLSTFPAIDRHAYKEVFLTELVRRPYLKPSDIVLVYGRTRFSDYVNEARRAGASEALGRLRRTARRNGTPVPPGAGRKARRTKALAAELGIATRSFARLGSAECLAFLKEFGPDVIHNVGGQYVPASVLEIPRFGVFSGHYALLPDVRGSDTVRWTIYLDLPMCVTHMTLAREMDMGDILRVERIAVQRGDSIGSIRYKCQMASARGHLELLDAVHAGTLTRRPQRKEEGSLFYRMGGYLKKKVDRVLLQHAYSHYVEADRERA